MKKIIFCLLIISIVLSFGCGPEEVSWHQENAKYKGLVYGSIFGTTLRCCDPGKNCADRKVETYIPNGGLRTYVEHDSLAWFFINENWQDVFPELINYPAVVDSIIYYNPKAIFTDNQGFVIFKDKNLLITDTSNVLFAFINRMKHPCDEQ